MSDLVVEIENIKKEKDYLYYVSFKTGTMQVLKARMQHKGRPKKPVVEKPKDKHPKIGDF